MNIIIMLGIIFGAHEIQGRCGTLAALGFCFSVLASSLVAASYGY